MDLEALVSALQGRAVELGVEICDAELLRGGAGGRGSSVLRITVDRDGAPLDLDAVASVSTAVAEVLDADLSLGPQGRYDLEVTSPGLERRLRRPSQYRRAVGRSVAVSVRSAPGAGRHEQVEGELRAADDAGISLSVAGSSLRFAYEEIEQAHTVFDWRAALAAARREEGVSTR